MILLMSNYLVIILFKNLLSEEKPLPKKEVPFKSLEKRNINKQKIIQQSLEKILNKKNDLESALKLANTTKNVSLSKNKNFKLPHLKDKKRKLEKLKAQNLDDSYHSTPEEKAEVEKKKKPSNFFGYEQKTAEDQQYHSKRINDLLKLELNILRKHDRVENNNKQTDYSEIFYQFKKQSYL